MAPGSPGRSDDLEVLAWAVCGVVGAVWLVVQAVGPDGVSVALLGLAALVLVGFTANAVRLRRRSRTARAERESGPVGGWAPQGRAPDDPAPDDPAPDGRVPDGPAGDPAVGARGDPPQLSPAGRAELDRVVGILDDAGLFAPRTPRPDDLAEATADAGEPVRVDAVLMAVEEAPYWHPEVDAAPYREAVAFHDSHVEQLPETLREHVADLARLTATPIGIEHVDVGERRSAVTLTVAGETLELVWESHLKYLSTVVHVAVARALPEVALAWTWGDQGVWLGVPRTPLPQLNAALDPAGTWSRVADEEPMAAGEVIRRGV